jgi:DNA-binding NtrC family response regulator
MNLDLLIFGKQKPDSPRPTQLTINSEDDVKRLRADYAGSVGVAAVAQLETLAAGFPGAVDKLRKKPKAKQLDDLMFRKEKVPLMDVRFAERSGPAGKPERFGYRTTGRLRAQGIQDLLKKAAQDESPNFYLLGVDAKTFEELRPKPGPQVVGAMDEQERLRRFKQDDDQTEALKRDFAGDIEAARVVRRMILIAAGSDEPVIILGASGTGKEIIARKIHELSPRHEGAIVPLNCAAFGSEMLEAELFGHVKGAFTYAVKDRPGLWEEAHQGTLFLDEIGDLSLEHQAKILRASRDRKIRRVGSNELWDADARLVTATNRDIDAMVRNGQFREDLYYRLAVLIIRTPTIREYQDEPGVFNKLAQHLWSWLEGEEKRTRPQASSAPPASELSAEVLDYLRRQSWPNNIRGLKNTLRRFRAVFGAELPTVGLLEFILGYMGQGPTFRQGSATGVQGLLSRQACLQQLDRAGESVRLCKNIIRPLLLGRTPSRKALRQMQERLAACLERLEDLCARPQLLLRAYEPLGQFKKRLYRFAEAFWREPDHAADCWQTAVDPDYEKAQAAINEEFRAMLEAS